MSEERKFAIFVLSNSRVCSKVMDMEDNGCEVAAQCRQSSLLTAVLTRPIPERSVSVLQVPRGHPTT